MTNASHSPVRVKCDRLVHAYGLVFDVIRHDHDETVIRVRHGKDASTFRIVTGALIVVNGHCFRAERTNPPSIAAILHLIDVEASTPPMVAASTPAVSRAASRRRA